MRSKDPHSEWPYASYVDRSSERVDIHLLIDAVEVWIEVGMYASDEKAKYYKDFLKLASVIDESPASIGILIHFEVYPRGVVCGILQEIKSQYDQQYEVDVHPFPNAGRTLAYRLSVQAKGQ